CPNCSTAPPACWTGSTSTPRCASTPPACTPSSVAAATCCTRWTTCWPTTCPPTPRADRLRDAETPEGHRRAGAEAQLLVEREGGGVGLDHVQEGAFAAVEDAADERGDQPGGVAPPARLGRGAHR